MSTLNFQCSRLCFFSAHACLPFFFFFFHECSEHVETDIDFTHALSMICLVLCHSQSADRLFALSVAIFFYVSSSTHHFPQLLIFHFLLFSSNSFFLLQIKQQPHSFVALHCLLLLTCQSQHTPGELHWHRIKHLCDFGCVNVCLNIVSSLSELF